MLAYRPAAALELGAQLAQVPVERTGVHEPGEDELVLCVDEDVDVESDQDRGGPW
ncbi:hypothetical protein [Micromonospora marina]|uniref:Uncharacterized protein n=2 Tax=Micromonospora marina TaxID=307120 RepID=A0A1C4ZKT6_9ACTN|nr:hypothetical protein GA0070215_11876 [Micromonospora marina]